MKRYLFLIFISVFLISPNCFSLDIGELGKTLEKAGVGNFLETSGIDLDKFTDYLNWENLNVSFISDFNNITAIGKKKVLLDGKLYKEGINVLRVDLKGGLEVPRKDGLRLFDGHLLYRILNKKAYLVFPKREAFVEIDPDEVREMLGSIMKKRDGKPKIEKKEFLGQELFDGQDCKKVFATIKFDNGTRTEVTTWLAQGLKGLPVKIIADFTTRRGITGSNTTTFTNIRKTEPDEELFTIPKNFTKYKNLVEVATEGKLGSHLKKRAK
jgi:hypothetical protein